MSLAESDAKEDVDGVDVGRDELDDVAWSRKT